VLPSNIPSSRPTSLPSQAPSTSPSMSPSSLPSLQPTKVPSHIPTSKPSSSPSLLPTLEPSSKPSTQPSYDPCRGFYGNYGDTIISSETTISYQYGVEYNSQANAPILDQIRDIESTMLELLIGELFSECRDIQAVPTSRRFLTDGSNRDEIRSLEYSHGSVPRTLVGVGVGYATDNTEARELLKLLIDGGDENARDLGHHTRKIRSSESIEERSLPANGVTLSNTNEDTTIIGIASSPVDLANGKKCQAGPTSPSISPDCNIIEGRLKVYLSDQSYAANATLATRQQIKTMMANGLLDKSHPAILSVNFMEDSRLELRKRSFGDDDEFQDATNIVPLGNRYIWAAAIGGLTAMTALISAGRYRLSSAQRRGEDGPFSEGEDDDMPSIDDSAADFVEVLSDGLSC